MPRTAPRQIHNLDALISSTGVPVRRLAAACDVVEKTIYNWRYGATPIPSDKLEALAGELGVSINQLMGWAGEAAA